MFVSIIFQHALIGRVSGLIGVFALLVMPLAGHMLGSMNGIQLLRQENSNAFLVVLLVVSLMCSLLGLLARPRVACLFAGIIGCLGVIMGMIQAGQYHSSPAIGMYVSLLCFVGMTVEGLLPRLAKGLTLTPGPNDMIIGLGLAGLMASLVVVTPHTLNVIDEYQKKADAQAQQEEKEESKKALEREREAKYYNELAQRRAENAAAEAREDPVAIAASKKKEADATLAAERQAAENRKIPIWANQEVTIPVKADPDVASRELWYRSFDGRAWSAWQKHGKAFNRDEPITWAAPEAHWQIYIRKILNSGLAMPEPGPETKVHKEFIIDHTAPARQ